MADAGQTSEGRDVEAQAQRFRDDYQAVRTQLARVIVGHDAVVDGVLSCVFIGGHVLLEGVPGIGKTLLVRTLSRALSLDFGRIQFTPDLMPADVMGTTIVHEVEGEGGRTQREFRFQAGPIFAQIVLADEINRATPKTQSALLEAMQEQAVTVAGETHPLPEPFFVMATQNPIEQEGTYPLPEAQMDRFFYKLLAGPPGRLALTEIVARTTAGAMAEVEPVLAGEAILSHQRLVREVAMAEHVRDYAVRMVLATHPAQELTAELEETEAGRYATPMVKQYVRMGASPRAAQSLVLGAKCQALLDGRSAAGIEDVRRVALPSLRHRIILNFEGEAQGITHDGIVRNIVDTLPIEGSAVSG